MKINVCLLLFIITVQVCSYKITYIHTSANVSQLSCLNQVGYLDQTIILMVYHPKQDQLRMSANPLDVIAITKAKPFAILRIEVVQNPSSATLQAFMYAQKLKRLQLKMIWVTIFDPNINCQYLLSFVKTLQKNLNAIVSVATWNGNFKSWDSCQQLGVYPLLWYQSSKNQLFQPFGPWTNYYLKLINQLELKCDVFTYQVTKYITMEN